MNEANQTYSLDELCALVELQRRTVRYYIQVGLVDRPEGAGRGSHYTSGHLEQLLEIRKWQQAGLSLDRIRELLGKNEGSSAFVPPTRPRQKGSLEVWSHLVIDDGIELTLEPKRANLTPEQVKELTAGVMDLYEKIKSEK